MSGLLYTVTLHPSLDCHLEVPSIPRPGTMIRTEKRHRVTAGGKGINLSRIYRLLGGETVALVSCGGRDAGRLKKKLEREDFSVVFLPGQSVRTDYEFSDGKKSIEINETGNASPDTVPQAVTYLKGHLKKGDLVVFSGSLPEGVGVKDFSLLLRTALACGAETAADVSGDALKAALDEGVSLIKPNGDEMERLLGDEGIRIPENLRPSERIEALTDFASEISERYGTAVLLTLGGKGASYVTSETAVFSPSFRLPAARRCKGAGDAFLGAFLYATRVEGAPAIEAMRIAHSASAAVLAGDGALSREMLLKHYNIEMSQT